jgi:hypothetical protein
MDVVQSTLPWTEEERASVLAHLDKLLDSPAFVGSRRRQAFLRYVVEQTLAGNGASIKERNIAVDVFERSNDFDAQSASIVRVTGSEVRKRLAQAYASGLDRGVRIELPLGSYQPVFHFDPEPDAAPAPQLVRPIDEPVKRSGGRLPWLVATAACTVLGAAIFLLPAMARGSSAGDRLWQPFLNHDQPVLLCLATLVGPATKGDDRGAQETSFVGTGGALGAARFAEQLALRHQTFTMKFGSDASFSDLKRSPAILIGSTRWADELMRALRFQIDRGDQMLSVVDSQAQGQRWSIPRLRPASNSFEGYSVVTRLLHSESGHPVILVAGLDPRDTQAAVEFVADEHLFEKFSRGAPSDWTRKNFQIVLHERIYGNSPGSLNVVASHLW